MQEANKLRATLDIDQEQIVKDILEHQEPTCRATKLSCSVNRRTTRNRKDTPLQDNQGGYGVEGMVRPRRIYDKLFSSID